MPSFGYSFSASSPVLTMPPQPAHQHGPIHMAPHQPTNLGFGSITPLNGEPISNPAPSFTGRPSASRKRSRDEASVNLNDEVLPAPTPIEPIKESEEDWIYGEGMVLIKPGAGYVADASSQSGTWVEEQAAIAEEMRRAELAAAAAAAEAQQQSMRPMLRSHKSQRLEQSSVASPGQAGVAQQRAPSPALPGTPGTSQSIPSLSTDTLNQPPVVDDFTLHLGIGWRRISDDEHIQAAARGWARYIENHYPVSAATIRLESKGLQSYLVEAAEGYFLFGEDLKQGRLVSRTVAGALANLKSSPPVFEGVETMSAAETPKPVVESPPAHHADVEMDMN